MTSKIACAIGIVFAALGCKPGASGASESKPSGSTADQSGVDTEAQKTKAAPAADEKVIPAPADVVGPPPDAEKTPSGLASKMLSAGKGGDKPHTYDRVKVNYTGWTTDGKMFESTIQSGSPATLGVDARFAGWTEGLQLMTVGEKRRFWIPEELGYKGRAGSPAGMLVFDVELLEIIPGQAPIPVPADVAAPPPDAEKTKSGLASKMLSPGTSKEKPKTWDKVTTHYSGWTTDGKMFDSSMKRGQPASFNLDRVIAGWTEGIPLMTVGEKRRFWIPEQLAYKGQAGAPAGMLVFDVELISIERMPEPPSAPKDVAKPPANAKKTASGLRYRVLKKGTGKTHPKAEQQVKVHYTGWTTDGKMFDSSVTRGEPASFGLNQVIAGWTEGVQLMVQGEKTRFWIPEELAYKGRPNAPAGMLVFDVELLEIEGSSPSP
jgi:FKBP-type peptidyl-prolyl cis-trans isomerase